MVNKRDIIAAVFCLSSVLVQAQDVWNLQRCIDYALENSIDMQKGQINVASSQVDTKQARAQWQPSLSFTTSHSLNNSPWANDAENKTSYNGNYDLGASWTVFNGLKRKYTIKMDEKEEDKQLADVENTEEDIKIAVLTDYIQVLYAMENVNIKKNSTEVAEAAYDRYKQLLDAGATSKSDFSQIEAQYVNEKYQLVVAENNLTQAKLNLKLLLRLDPNTDLEIFMPEISEEEILKAIDDKGVVFDKALEVRPDIKSAEMNEEIAEYKIKTAKSGLFPSVSLSAGVGTGHNSNSDLAVGKQMKQNFGENVGLSLRYNILDNRSTKSEIEKAKLNQRTSQLQTEQAKDDLQKLIESAHNDAVAAQMSYIASKSSESATQASYDLTKEKFDLGMKNPYEMLSEKNSLLSAQQQTLQAKYTAILNVQVLNVYQGLPITLE